jgi:hypothetical protein
MASYKVSAPSTPGADSKCNAKKFDGRARSEIKMQDAINLLMLACASLAALALGVLLAYGVCRAAFAAIRLHARSISAQTSQPDPQSQIQTQTEPQIASL